MKPRKNLPHPPLHISSFLFSSPSSFPSFKFSNIPFELNFHEGNFQMGTAKLRKNLPHPPLPSSPIIISSFPPLLFISFIKIL